MSIAERLQQSVGRTIVSTHVRVYETTNGAIGSRIVGGPCMILSTVGAKSGLQRKTPLGYAMDGADYLVVPSNNGSDQAPGWLANIKRRDEVEMQVGADHVHGRARVVAPETRDYDRLFALVNANFSGRYYGYQQKTERPIPVVVITPTETS